MVIHEMHLDSVPFNRVSMGSKTVELRLYDSKRRKLNIGDKIVFINLQHKRKRVVVVVMGLFRFASFRDAFRIFSDKYFGFRHLSLDQKILKVRKYYSLSSERKAGVLAIWLKKL